MGSDPATGRNPGLHHRVQRRTGYAPTLQEIGERFGLSSVATVHKHVSHLVDKGYLKRERPNASRDLEVVDQTAAGDGLASIPLLGTVAAGLPIEALDDQEEIVLPEEWLGKGRTFALRVRGDSMIDEQIRDGDTVVVEAREDGAQRRDGHRPGRRRIGHGQAVLPRRAPRSACSRPIRPCRCCAFPRNACASRAWSSACCADSTDRPPAPWPDAGRAPLAVCIRPRSSG